MTDGVWTNSDGDNRGIAFQEKAISRQVVTIPSATSSINFHSILFETSYAENPKVKIEPSDFVHDLNIDQIVDAITAVREEYNLKPFFYNTRLETGFGADLYQEKFGNMTNTRSEMFAIQEANYDEA